MPSIQLAGRVDIHSDGWIVRVSRDAVTPEQRRKLRDACLKLRDARLKLRDACLKLRSACLKLRRRTG
jgi:hypothetical protein